MDLSDLGNLAFVLIALLAWVVKAAFERKEANARERLTRRAPGTGEARPARVPDVGPAEPDVVYGRRPLPAHYEARGDGLQPSRPPAKAPPPLPSASRSMRNRQLPTIEDRHLKGRLVASEAATVRQSQAGTNARRRLGFRRLGGRRDAMRAALLWHEVLGSPRAFTGPHRPPYARRFSR